MPIEIYSNWNSRPSDKKEKREPYRKYYFICEGRNTEPNYFKALISNKRSLGINSLIEICLMEKVGEDENKSHPRNLIAFADKVKTKFSANHTFYRKRDKIIIVFDADRFESGHDKNYNDIIKCIEEKEYWAAVTNPSFELFLLLHYPNSYTEIIFPLKDDFLKKENLIGKPNLITKVFIEKSGMHPKHNKEIGNLIISKLSNAIEQEQNINQDIHICIGNLTSNVGKIIQSIIDDNCLE